MIYRNYNSNPRERLRENDNVLNGLLNENRRGNGVRYSTAGRYGSVMNNDVNYEDESYDSSENEYPLSMVYSPSQGWKELYGITEGINKGTIFKELDFPFYPTSCCNENCRED